MKTTQKMNARLMAGQRLILGFDGTVFSDDLKHIIRDLNACGIILFSQNIQSPQQVSELCARCQDYAKTLHLPPLIICTDQEGGVVARFKKPFTQFQGNPSITTVDAAKEFAQTTAAELGQVGINMNLAPVLDIVPEGNESVMADRAFKGDAQTVSRLGCTIISTLQKNRMMAVAKHFPGIGRTVLDSHFHLPVLETDADDLKENDLIPFADAIAGDVAGMMLSHIFYPKLDSQWQASLSPAIARDLLRKRMGYDGLVFTDDLDMKAIQLDIKTCIRQILLADIDIALICHNGPDMDAAWQHIMDLHHQDHPLRQAGKICLERILRYKNRYLN